MTFSWLFVLLSSILLFANGRRNFSNKNDFQNICANISSNEYFRLNDTKGCELVYQCTDTNLISLKCNFGLVFDVENQVCNWRSKVNCNQLRKSYRIENIGILCGDNQFKCKSDECIPLKLKCNNDFDCMDGSDELNCNNNLDQAPLCNPSNCSLPECFCSESGKEIPLNLSHENIPQMIMITFDDAININNIEVYEQIFNNERFNPNGCTIKGGFFVSNKYTNYSTVEYLHKIGHEIAVHSITHNSKEDYWKNINSEQWSKEIAGSRMILERFANITDGSILGMRAPMLRLGGVNQFSMLEEQSFLYDSTIVAPLSRVPYWPYTLHYRMPHKCYGKKQKCPIRSHAVWEIVMNELNRKLHPKDNELSGCSMIDQCSNIQDGQQFYMFLENNFKRHYESNRAPLGLFFHASWILNEDFIEVLTSWIDEKLKDPNVYFVTPTQVIKWIQEPTELDSIRGFEPWKTKCNEVEPSICYDYKDCVLNSRELPGEALHLQTCMDCPKNYPWVEDPFGEEL